MNIFRWLFSILKRRNLRLKPLLTLWKVIQRYLSCLNGTRKPQRPPDEKTRHNDLYTNPAEHPIAVCSSLAPYHISETSSSHSSQDIIDRSARLHATSGLGRRSRSHTPSFHYSRNSTPDTTDDSITQNVEQPSPIEESGSRLNTLLPSGATSQVNLADFRHLNVSTRRLPPRAGSPSLRAPSIRSYSRVPSPSLRAPSPFLRAPSRTSYATPPHVDSRPLTPPSHAPSVIAPSQCSVRPPEVPKAELSQSFTDFYPISPEVLQRYERAVFVENVATEFSIAPMTKTFQVEHGHEEWSTYIHPEGARYYFHKTKRVFTDADLCNPEVMSLIAHFLEQMEDFVTARDIEIPSNVDLVLDLVRNADDGQMYCAYYLADHEHRTVFWLDSYQATSFDIWHEVRGVKSASQVGHIVESEYWYHCQLYPTCCLLTPAIVDDLRGLLIHAIGDTITSPLSTSPYPLTELQQILGLANSIRKNVASAGTISPGSTSALGRFMFLFVRQRFYHFFGEQSARLERERSVYGILDSRRTLLIALLSPLLFFAPDVHLRGLEKIWVDGILNNSVWGSFIGKLTSEWQEFILYATVLLNANVAFLAIQSVDEGTALPSRTAAQISSYLSVISSIGSIIIGLLLVRQNRSKARETAREALVFLNSQQHNMLGLETLAIMYSIPYALLMWAMVSFLLAFTLMCFVGSNVTVRLLVGGAWMAVGCLVLWCVRISWEAKQQGNRWYMLALDYWLQLLDRMSGSPVVSTFKRKIAARWHRESVDTQGTVVV